MTGCCNCSCSPLSPGSARQRRVLLVGFVLNALMFVVEIVSGLWAGSSALQADALDFFSDAANLGISLFVLNQSPRHRSRASLIKGGCMAAFGTWVLASTLWHLWLHGIPEAHVMGIVGAIALLTNGTIAFLLYAFRDQDSNMRSAWICARNDAICNLAVMAAAAGVMAMESGLPDLAVAFLIGGLNVSGAVSIIRQARAELKQA